MMKLNDLLAGWNPVAVYGSSEKDVTDLQVDHRNCRGDGQRGSGFVCIKGFTQDGHRFAADAVRRGASVIFATDSSVIHSDSVLRDATVVLLPDTRMALPALADRLYGHPSGKIKLIGITGTKGKTSTSYLIRSIYEHAGIRTGLIGTIQNIVGDMVLETDRTTPEANVLQELLDRMVREKAEVCIMEASSQGLNLGRVAHCEFHTGIFTNLSRDHIGPTEHASMEDYAQAKAKLFTMCRNGVINIDSPYAEVMMQAPNCRYVTYGIEGKCDFKAVRIQTAPDHVAYDIEGPCGPTHVVVSSPGRFSVYNSLAAIVCCYLEGLPMETILAGIRGVSVPGKAEVVPTGRDFSILIDYAHNPDSFINILTTVKEYAKRTVFLFGCGGDRNRPRELMGKTAGEYADFTIITSDNPRSEDPESIVRDLEQGIRPTGAPYVCIVDRREAISYALRHAKPGDVIILAGKGHETYQILKDHTVPFDERQIVREILEQMDREQREGGNGSPDKRADPAKPI